MRKVKRKEHGRNVFRYYDGSRTIHVDAIHQDDYFRSKLPPWLDWNASAAIDTDALCNVLRGEIEDNSLSFIIIEGFRLFSDERIVTLLDLMLWIEILPEVLQKRFSKKTYFRSRVWPSHRRYAVKKQNEAHFTLDGMRSKEALVDEALMHAIDYYDTFRYSDDYMRKANVENEKQECMVSSEDGSRISNWRGVNDDTTAAAEASVAEDDDDSARSSAGVLIIPSPVDRSPTEDDAESTNSSCGSFINDVSILSPVARTLTGPSYPPLAPRAPSCPPPAHLLVAATQVLPVGKRPRSPSSEDTEAFEQKVLQAIRRICPQHVLEDPFQVWRNWRRCGENRRTVLESTSDGNTQRKLEPHEITRCYNTLLEIFKREEATPKQLQKSTSQICSIYSAWLRNTCGSQQAAIVIFELGLPCDEASFLSHLTRIAEHIETQKGYG